MPKPASWAGAGMPSSVPLGHGGASGMWLGGPGGGGGGMGGAMGGGGFGSFGGFGGGMGGFGGHSSSIGGGPRGQARPGDWTCPECSANVFASRDKCFRCSTARPGSDAGAGGCKARDDQPEPSGRHGALESVQCRSVAKRPSFWPLVGSLVWSDSQCDVYVWTCTDSVAWRRYCAFFARDSRLSGSREGRAGTGRWWHSHTGHGALLHADVDCEANGMAIGGLVSVLCTIRRGKCACIRKWCVTLPFGWLVAKTACLNSVPLGGRRVNPPPRCPPTSC
eukprot:scaffold81500_cov24-Tisochrysis_lutea.AAC.2